MIYTLRLTNAGLQPPSIHSMWLIEDADPSDGRKLDYDAPIRIRNVATGGYL